MQPSDQGPKNVVLLGHHDRSLLALVERSAGMASREVSVVSDVDQLTENDLADAAACVLDMDKQLHARFATELRARFPLVPIPVIGVTNELSGLRFEEAFTTGIDDCAPRDDRALGRLIRALSIQPRGLTRMVRAVLIAEPAREARLHIGRVFRNAGYDVRFAVTATEVIERLSDANVEIVVCNEELEIGVGGDESLAMRAQAAGSRAVWVINTPPKHIAAARQRLTSLDTDCRIDIHDAYAPPSHLLFISNELQGHPGAEARRSERLLYGAPVCFRPAGQPGGHVGYLYNISAGGVYVQTLALPEPNSDLWLEFVPPRTDRAVHLEANAVWRRGYGPGMGANVPSGFGAMITAATPTDMQRYQAGYETYRAERSAAP